jgi:nitrate reductase NapD
VNISAILVVAEAGRSSEVASTIAALPGVELHLSDAPSGRLIIIQEAADIDAEIAGLRSIKALPHVVMAEMIYHYFAEDEDEYRSFPAELADRDASCGVPACVMD